MGNLSRPFMPGTATTVSATLGMHRMLRVRCYQQCLVRPRLLCTQKPGNSDAAERKALNKRVAAREAGEKQMQGQQTPRDKNVALEPEMEVAKTPTSPKSSTETPATMSAMTVREKFAHMRKHYGIPFLIYWTGMWAATGVIIYSGIELGGVDSVAAVRALDAQFGTDMASHINPSAGNLAVAIAVNEIIE